MSEYIVDTFGIVQDFADLHGDMNTPLYQAIMDVMVSRQREEIVRCKDCRYFRAETMKHPALCRLWISRALFRQTVTGITTYLPKQCKVKPGGFCAWGEKAVDE